MLEDYDPNSAPADAIIVTKSVRGEQCYDERREPEAMACELARHGVRAYQLTPCDDCLDVCAACGCPLDQFFAVKIEPAQLDAAESAGWRQGASLVDDCNKEVGWDCGPGW